MKKIKIVDKSFSHCKYSNNPLPPTSFSKYIEWDRKVSDVEELVFYTDGDILKPIPGHRKKIAWLLEPYVKQPNIYEWILQNNKLYDYVLTNEKKLLDRGENFIYYPFGGCWIDKKDRTIEHEKTKLVSIVASAKKNVPDHLKRHEIISKHKDIIDVMGRGYKPLDKIVDGLKDYMFNFSMENQTRDYHFSEKIINPIMVGTVPIYYGCESISKYFDTRGMVIFKEVSEVQDILKEIGSKMYNGMLPYIKENFKIAHQYILSEDWMYENKVLKEIGVI